VRRDRYGDRLRLLINSKSDLTKKKKRGQRNHLWFNEDKISGMKKDCLWERHSIFSKSYFIDQKENDAYLRMNERTDQLLIKINSCSF